MSDTYNFKQRFRFKAFIAAETRGQVVEHLRQMIADIEGGSMAVGGGGSNGHAQFTLVDREWEMDEAAQEKLWRLTRPAEAANAL